LIVIHKFPARSLRSELFRTCAREYPLEYSSPKRPVDLNTRLCIRVPSRHLAMFTDRCAQWQSLSYTCCSDNRTSVTNSHLAKERKSRNSYFRNSSPTSTATCTASVLGSLMIDRRARLQPWLILINFSSRILTRHCDTSAPITILVRYSRGRIDTLMELRHARAVSTWRLGIACRMPIARDARHAVIEGTRVQRRSRFRRGNISAGYFGDHDVRFHHRTPESNLRLIVRETRREKPVYSQTEG